MQSLMQNLNPRDQRRYAKPTLQRRGTQTGDMMALTAMRDNRTLPEPTHELQCYVGDGEWECYEVGTHADMVNARSHKVGTARGFGGRWRGNQLRVVERKPLD